MRKERRTSSDLSSLTCLRLLPGETEKCSDSATQHLLRLSSCTKLHLQNSKVMNLSIPANSSAVSGHVVCGCVAQMSSLSHYHHVIAHKHVIAAEQPMAFLWLITASTHHRWLTSASIKDWWYHLITFNYLPISLLCRYLAQGICQNPKLSWNASKNSVQFRFHTCVC